MVEIEIPFPPSVNRIWRQVSGRTLLSAEGRAYRANVARVVMAARPAPLGGARIQMTISAWMPDRRRRDLDNLAKASLDAMAHAGMYDDDCQIDDLRIVRAGLDRERPRLDVSIRQVGRSKP